MEGFVMMTQMLNIYDTVVTVHSYQFDADITIEGLPGEVPESILFGSEYTEVNDRHASSYVVKGFEPKTTHIVLAKGLDQKQLANILYSLGAIDAVAYEVDTDFVTVINNNPEKIPSSHVHVSEEEVKPKDKKKRRK
jgi:hypothetical protein